MPRVISSDCHTAKKARSSESSPQQTTFASHALRAARRGRPHTFRSRAGSDPTATTRHRASYTSLPDHAQPTDAPLGTGPSPVRHLAAPVQGRPLYLDPQAGWPARDGRQRGHVPAARCRLRAARRDASATLVTAAPGNVAGLIAPSASRDRTRCNDGGIPTGNPRMRPERGAGRRISATGHARR